MRHFAAHGHRPPREPEEAGIIVELPPADTAPVRGKRLLYVHEVMAAGEPAFFDDFGEKLQFVNGQLLDLRAATRAPSGVLRAPALPESVLREGVGLEFGWRHASGCGCSFCEAVQDGSDKPARQAEEAA